MSSGLWVAIGYMGTVIGLWVVVLGMRVRCCSRCTMEVHKQMKIPQLCHIRG